MAYITEEDGLLTVVEKRFSDPVKVDFFHENFSFMYLSRLIGQVFESTERGRLKKGRFKKFIKGDMKHSRMAISRFDIDGLEMDGDTVCLPYASSKEGDTRRPFLRYYLAAHDPPQARGKRYVEIAGDLRVICENGGAPASDAGTTVTVSLPAVPGDAKPDAGENVPLKAAPEQEADVITKGHTAGIDKFFVSILAGGASMIAIVPGVTAVATLARSHPVIVPVAVVLLSTVLASWYFGIEMPENVRREARIIAASTLRRLSEEHASGNSTDLERIFSRDFWAEEIKGPDIWGKADAAADLMGRADRDLRQFIRSEYGGAGNTVSTADLLPLYVLYCEEKRDWWAITRAVHRSFPRLRRTGERIVRGGSRGIEGLPNAAYTDELKKAIDTGNIMPMEMGYEWTYMVPVGAFRHDTRGMVPVMGRLYGRVDIRDVNQAVESLSPEDKELLGEVQTIFFKGRRKAHYGLSRRQIYINIRYAKDPARLAVILHHELQERKHVIDCMNRYYPDWRTKRGEKEIEAAIDMYAAEKHKELREMEERLYGGIVRAAFRALRRLLFALPKMWALKRQGYAVRAVYSERTGESRYWVRDGYEVVDDVSIPAAAAADHVGRLARKYGFGVEERAALEFLAHEMVCNMIEFGDGGAFGVKLLRYAGVVTGIEVVGWDSGDGIKDPEALRISSERRYTETQDGIGFWRLAHDADDVTIESMGKCWERIDTGRFRESHIESDIREGTRIEATVFRHDLARVDDRAVQTVPNVTGNADLPEIDLHYRVSYHPASDGDKTFLSVVVFTVLDGEDDSHRGIRLTVEGRRMEINDYFPVGHPEIEDNSDWRRYHGRGISQSVLFWISSLACSIGVEEITVTTPFLHNAHVFGKSFATGVEIKRKTYDIDDPRIFTSDVMGRLRIFDPDTYEIAGTADLEHISGNEYRVVYSTLKVPGKGGVVAVRNGFLYDAAGKLIGLAGFGAGENGETITMRFYGPPRIPREVTEKGIKAGIAPWVIRNIRSVLATGAKGATEEEIEKARPAPAPAPAEEDTGGVLVIGAAGFIGKKVFADLRMRRDDVHGADIRKDADFDHVDVTDPAALEALIRKRRPGTIIYSPAVRVLEAEQEPSKAAAVFVDPLATIHRCFSGRLIYISSNQVFYGDQPPYGTSALTDPKNAYGRAKVKAEEYVVSNFPDHVILRPGYVSGYNGFAVDHLTRMVVSRLDAGEEIHLDDSNIRRPVDVDDVTRFIVDAAYGDTRGIFQINGQTPVTKYAWAVYIAEFLGYPEEYIDAHIIPTSNDEPYAPRDAEMVNSYAPAVKFNAGMQKALMSVRTREIPGWPEAGMSAEWKVLKGKSPGTIRCVMRLLRDGTEIGHAGFTVEARGIVLYSCADLDIREQERERGFGSRLLLRGIMLAAEEARKRGMDVNWAYVYYTANDDGSEGPAVEVLKSFLEDLGFTDDIAVGRAYGDYFSTLAGLIDTYPDPSYAGGSGCWFARIDDVARTYTGLTGDSDDGPAWVKGVKVVDADPSGEEIKVEGDNVGDLTMMMRVLYKGQWYYGKMALTREDEEKLIVPEAEVMKKINALGINGVPRAEHFLELEDGNKMILFSEFPSGRTLQEAVSGRGGLSRENAVAIMLKVSRVVEDLHANGVYHWDIKPANIWIADDGGVILFDFDLAFSNIEEFRARELFKARTFEFESRKRFGWRLRGEYSDEYHFPHTEEEVFSLGQTLLFVLNRLAFVTGNISLMPDDDEIDRALRDLVVLTTWGGESEIRTAREFRLALEDIQGISGANRAVPPGSPLAVFNFLLKEDRPFTESEICAGLARERSTLAPDFRALVNHLGLARSSLVDGEPAYELFSSTRAHAPRVIDILAELQEEHGYRPKVEYLKAVGAEIEAAVKYLDFGKAQMDIATEVQTTKLFLKTDLIPLTLERCFGIRCDRSQIGRTIVEPLKGGTMRRAYVVTVHSKDDSFSPQRFVLKITISDHDDYNTVAHESVNRLINEGVGRKPGYFGMFADGRIVSTGMLYPGKTLADWLSQHRSSPVSVSDKDMYNVQKAIAAESAKIWQMLGRKFIKDPHQRQYIVDRDDENDGFRAVLVDKGFVRHPEGPEQFRLEPGENRELYVIYDRERISGDQERVREFIQGHLEDVSEKELLERLKYNLRLDPGLRDAISVSGVVDPDMEMMSMHQEITEPFETDMNAVVEGVVEALGPAEAGKFFASYMDSSHRSNDVEKAIERWRRSEPAIRFDMPESIETSAEALDVLFNNEINARRFFALASGLRQEFPYDMTKDDVRPPLEYALEEGIYYRIGPDLYITPVTESFRRHIVFSMDELGDVKFAFEVIMPGEREGKREVRTNKRYSIAEDLIAKSIGYPLCERPIFKKVFPHGQYEFYGKDVTFDGTCPLRVMAAEYIADGKRLEFVTPSMIEDIARRTGIPADEVAGSIAAQSAGLMAAVYAAGYVGHEHRIEQRAVPIGDTGNYALEATKITNYELHVSNLRLIVEEGAVRVTLAGDFEGFSRQAKYANPDPEKALDMRMMLLGIRDRMPGLADVTGMDIVELRLMLDRAFEVAPGRPGKNAPGKGLTVGYEIEEDRSRAERKKRFTEDIKEDSILRFLSEGKGDVLRGLPGSDLLWDLRFRYMGCLYNAFDSVVDRIEGSRDEGFAGGITSGLTRENGMIVLSVTDNGATAKLGTDGIPLRRARYPDRHFGGRGEGAGLMLEFAEKYGATVEWVPLDNGTRIEIRIPEDNFPEGFAVSVTDPGSENNDVSGIYDGEAVRVLTAVGSFSHGTNRATEVRSPIGNAFMHSMVVRDDVLKEESLYAYHEEVKAIHEKVVEATDIVVNTHNASIRAIEYMRRDGVPPDAQEAAGWKEDLKKAYKLLVESRSRLNDMAGEIRPHLESHSYMCLVFMSMELERGIPALRDRICLMDGRVEDEVFDLREILEGLYDELADVTEKDFREHFRIDVPDGPLLIRGNRRSVISLMCNLAANGHRHAKELMGDAARVTICAHKEGDKVKITVSDNGIGIPREELADVWEPFYSTTGSGIGLTEARLIAEDHGGGITIESRYLGDVENDADAGTVFTASIAGAEEGREYPQDEKEVEDFLDTIIYRVSRMEGGGNIIIGLDTSWIPAEQLSAIQGMLNSLSHMRRKKGLGKIIVRRRRRPADLVRVLLEEHEKDRERNPVSNMVIIGSEKVLSPPEGSVDRFKPLREPEDGSEGAFFGEIMIPETGFPAGGLIELPKWIRQAVEKNFGSGKDKRLTFRPTRSYDMGELKKIYELYRDRIRCAA